MGSFRALFVPNPAASDPAFLIDDREPAYLAAARNGLFEARVEAALKELEDCCACPRNCHVNRLANETRVCKTKQEPERHFLHKRLRKVG